MEESAEDACEVPDTFAANDARLGSALLAGNVLAAGADLRSHDETVRMSRERLCRLEELPLPRGSPTAQALPTPA